MSELDEILNGEHQLNKMHIENDTVAFNTEKDNYVWNLTPRDIEYIIYNLQQELNKKNKIIEDIKNIIELNQYNYGYQIKEELEELEKGSKE